MGLAAELEFSEATNPWLVDVDSQSGITDLDGDAQLPPTDLAYGNHSQVLSRLDSKPAC